MNEYFVTGLVFMALGAWVWGIYSYVSGTKEHCASE